jgi:hypothetical protein
VPVSSKNISAQAPFIIMSTAAKPKSSGKKDKDDSGNPDLSIASIGNYTFQKTVGEGNFAKVKLALHKLTGQEVGFADCL